MSNGKIIGGDIKPIPIPDKWKIKPVVAADFKAMHGEDTEIYQNRISRVKRESRILAQDKEFLITETVKNGFSDVVMLEYNGQTRRFKHVVDAEKEIVEILRGKTWPS